MPTGSGEGSIALPTRSFNVSKTALYLIKTEITTKSISDSKDFSDIDFTTHLPIINTTKLDVFERHVAVSTSPMISIASTTIPQTSSASSDKLAIVGITCGMLGVILGIVVSAAFWTYKKRKTQREQKIVMEKNPKEKTFEPLDLSLTLPNYQPNDLHKNSSASSHISVLTRPKYNNSGHFSNLPEASVSNPTIHNAASLIYSSEINLSKIKHKTISKCQQRRNHFPNSKSWDRTSSLDCRVLKQASSRNRLQSCESEINKHLTSLPERESFSSGLGTCTESEVCSFEDKSQTGTRIENETQDKTKPSMQSIRAAERNQRAKQRFRSQLNSSLASSHNSIHDWSSSEASTSPTSTLPYDDKTSPNSRAVSLNHQTGHGHDEEELLNCNQAQTHSNKKAEEKDTHSVNTAPNISVSDSNEMNETAENYHKETTLIRRNSDVIIDL